jgi:hypothetical protein
MELIGTNYAGQSMLMRTTRFKTKLLADKREKSTGTGRCEDSYGINEPKLR